MFEKLGHSIARRSKAIFLLAITAVLIFGTLGTQVFSRFDSGGYSDPNSDSAKVWEYLEDTFGVKDPAVVIALESSAGSVDAESTVAAATALENQLRAEPSAEDVLSYWSAGRNPAFKSTDGTAAYMFIYLKSEDFTEIDSLGGYYQDKYEGEYQDQVIRVSGGAVFANAINGRIQDDLKLSEAISIPITFILLVLVFGALVASAMPLIIGVTAILGTFFGLYLLTLVTDVSIFALNLTTGLGLGLGIDYALLIVNRFREELRRGISREDAIVNTMRNAGKTVFYSGLTVVLTLIALTFFPMNFLKSMGYAGAIVVSLAVVGALIPLPALLMMLGEKVNKGVVRKSGLNPKEDGGWARLSRFVMRRPVPVVAFSLLLLGLMIAPLTNVKFSQVDSRVLPASDPAYQASAFIQEKFPGQESNPIEIIFPAGASNIMLECKSGDNLDGNEQRWNANNSVVWAEEPTWEQFSDQFDEMVRSGRGEPGFFSRVAANDWRPERRKPAEFGTNPCGEIALRSMQLCNLSAAIARADDTYDDMADKVEVATIIGTIQSMATNFPGLRPQWQRNCEEERLLGVDITGQMDAPHLLGLQDDLLKVAQSANVHHASLLGINPSAAITCVKPSGNTSQLVNCSSGLHARWSPYYIRNVRVGAHSPIYQVLRDAGAPMVPENGQTAENATTWVVQFPVRSPEGAITRNDHSAIEQCDIWLQNKMAWTEHNPSCTVTYRPHEVEELKDWVWGNRHVLGGMSFLPASDAMYDNMPYVEIDREEYERRAAAFPEIDFSRIYHYERTDLTNAAQELACVAGLCEI